ncbi:uncharacterized protein B0P05DRAFT_584878 [Gilbertella persicaria]|uniref:uncharacterized protein n=1 Tax=Gilbertella persicaria TaxID=101096 RepID=UPI002220EF5C|nr:uncharacterized protein B0P05DRAFT_584878 [Gilbertella persicaria]KAI8087650.1 hypothetical protein B0P05DRAFT_584878 [Gilbertella persicaria]
MSKLGKALAVSFGAFAGGVAGFYFLEMYKIKSKEQRLAMLLAKKQEYEKMQNNNTNSL